MAINVDRNNSDQFYRYKMPRLVAKVEGSGNGIKTVVANITDIAKSLDRPPTYPLKYFGYELGAQTMVDSKNERYIVNGSHDAQRLQEMLDGFIKKFVLCPNCNNPETVLQVHVKKQTIRQNCAACGHNAMVDMKHKLTTYILKNPPAEVGEYGESKAKVKGKGKARKGDEKKENGAAKNGNGTKTNGNGAAPTSPTTETDMPGFDVPPPVDDDHDNDFADDWGDDETDAAKEGRRKELTNGIANLTLNEDLEKTEDERLDMFYEYVKKRKDADQVDDKEILAEADRLEVKEKAPLILARVLLDENMLKQISRYRKVFLRFTMGNQRAQKYLLGGFEHIVGVACSTFLMGKCMSLLKELYDQDILEEEVLLDWFDKPSKKYVSKAIAEDIRKKVSPFITWLKTAESESDESDLDDIPVSKSAAKASGDGKSGNKVTNGNGLLKTAAAAGHKVNGHGGNVTPPTDDDETDAVDIDAI